MFYVSAIGFTICSSMPDHHLTTTARWHRKMSRKPVVTTNNELFLGLTAAVQNRQILRFNVGLYRLVVVLRPKAHFQLRRFTFCAVKSIVLSTAFLV